MLQAFPQLKWDQSLKGKRWINYGQPVLIGAGATPLNPVRLMVNCAYGFALWAETGVELSKVFGVWSHLAREGEWKE